MQLRRRVGKKPGPQYKRLTKIENWIVYEENGDEYINLKIISETQVRGRANFWLNYSKNLEKILFRRDFFCLKEYYPDLLEKICRMYGTSINDALENYVKGYKSE